MSFGFSVGDIIAVANLASKVRKQFVDAPGHFKAASDEVKGLSNVLRDLEDVFPERSLTASQAADLSEILQGCRDVLAELDRILDKYHDLSDAAGRSGTGLARKSRRIWKKLTFEPDDVKDLRSRLTSSVSLLDIFMGSHALGLSHLTKAGVDRLNKYQDDENCLAIINWLSDTNFPAQQLDFFRKCQEGTGQWLLDTTEFKSWLDGKESLLFCPGIPGAGKTFLTSIVINHLQERFGQDPDVGIACLYCNFKRQAEQTVENLIASLFKQLLQGRPDFDTDFKSLYQTHSDKGTRPSLGELSTALNNITLKLSRVFIVVDALDECTDPRVRSSFIKKVSAIRARDYSSVFATSRFLPEILSEFDGKLSMNVRATEGDVRRYLDHHIIELPICVRLNQPLQETIITDIANAVDGMFLLAQLHLDSLSGKTTVKAVKIALQKLPKGSEALDTAYNEALERIETQKPDRQLLAKQVLSWVVYATRQLSMSELRYALAVEDGATEFDEENLPEPDDIISVCAGLVTVGEGSDTVRLVHYTTQEYLERALPFWAPQARLEITKMCLTYLSLDKFEGIPDLNTITRDAFVKYKRLCRTHHLLPYALKYWHVHAENCWSDSVETMVISFLEKSSAIYWWARLECHSLPTIRKQSTAIHFAACIGSIKLASSLLRAGHDPQVHDSHGRTPLFYAAIYKQQAIIRWLLNLDGTNPNTADKNGNSLLHRAAHGERDPIVVKLLLERKDIEADKKDGKGRTPLQLACYYGRKPMVKLLIERSDVDVNYVNEASETPLLTALRNGEEATAITLLERDDILINVRNSKGTTPLAFAARRRLERIVKLLLARKDIILDAETLSCVFVHAGSFKKAAIPVIKKLMKCYNVQINVKYKEQTILMLAASEGNTSVVKLLLSKPKIQVNRKDPRGFTALMFAADAGHEGALKLLLEQNDIEINCRDSRNYTALGLAIRRGRQDAVKLLLEKPDIEVNCKEEKNRTALMLAAKNGEEEIVKLLLERDDIEINCRDVDDETAMMLAYKHHHKAVVDLLEQAGAKGEIPEVGLRDYDRDTSMETSSEDDVDMTESDDSSAY